MDLWSLAELGDGLIDESVLATTALLLQGHEVECKLMSETAPIRRSGLLGGQSLPRASSFGVSHLKSGVDVRLLEHDAYLERCSSDKTIGDILCTCSKCDKESAIAAVRTRAKLSLVDTPHPTTHQTALYIAALHGNQDFIAHLLQQGGNVNALNTVSLSLAQTNHVCSNFSLGWSKRPARRCQTVSSKREFSPKSDREQLQP